MTYQKVTLFREAMRMKKGKSSLKSLNYLAKFFVLGIFLSARYDLLLLFQYMSNKMQLYTLYLYLKTALHVSGGTATHHQERIQLYLQHLVFVTPIMLSAAIVEELELEFQLLHPKHEEQYPDLNKLCNVASFWIYIYIGKYDTTPKC